MRFRESPGRFEDVMVDACYVTWGLACTWSIRGTCMGVKSPRNNLLSSACSPLTFAWPAGRPRNHTCISRLTRPCPSRLSIARPDLPFASAAVKMSIVGRTDGRFRVRNFSLVSSYLGNEPSSSERAVDVRAGIRHATAIGLFQSANSQML